MGWGAARRRWRYPPAGECGSGAWQRVASQLVMETSAVCDFSQTLAGVVAVDGGTIGLDVSFAAFLAVILGTFVPVVFLVVVYVQSAAQGFDTSMRMPDVMGPDGKMVKGPSYEEMD